MFVVSKLKQVMGHGSSGDNNTEAEGEAAKSDEECKGNAKGDVEELLEQCSQFEEMDTQDVSDSPILFPSQTSDDKEKNEEEDSDCYEIVDNISTVKGSEKEKHATELNNKSRLSLGRKRQVCEKSGECSARDSSSSKQRRVENEDNDLCNTTTSHKERCLFRAYKRPVCENIEEADRRNLFYAPRHVKPALYTPTIVRKLESYRWRLRHAQSSLRSYVFPPHSKAIDPILARSRGRLCGRIKRVSVMKKSAPDYKKWAEGKRNIDPFVATLYDILVSKVKEEVHNAASSSEALDKQPTNNNGDDEDDDVVCTKVSHSSRKTSKPAETTEPSTSGTSQHTDVINDDATEHDVAMETEDCDVPVKTVDNDVVVEAVNGTVNKETVNNDVVAGNVKNAVVMETINNKTSSPVKPVLPEARRKIILEEDNDDDFEKFNFHPSVEENKTEEEDCVVVEAVSSTSVAMGTTHQEKVDHIECPMCYKKFPQDTVQQHAFHCNGLDEASTSSVR